MKILERYFFWENIKPFLLSLVVITFVMMLDRLIDLLNVIIEKQLDFLTIISLFSLSLPFILALSVPIAVLTSSIMSFGRMAVDQELTAVKACGVNIYKKMTLLYIIALFLAGGMAYFNDFILPDTNHVLKNLMIKVTYRKPINAIKPGTFTSFENISVYAKEAVGEELHGVIIYNRESSSFPTTITASKGTISIENNANKVRIDLYDGEMHEKDAHEQDKYQIRYFKHYSLIKSDLGFQIDNSPTSYRGDREMNSKQIMSMVESRKKDIDRLENELKPLRESLQELPTNLEDQEVYIEHKKLNNMIKLKVAEKDEIEKTIRVYQVEMHKKYALAFACFVFFLIGAPIGMMTKTSGIGMAFSVSAVIFLIFYVMIVGGEQLGDRGLLSPALSMWIPNIIFLVLGMIVTYTSYKEKSLIDLDRLNNRIKKLMSRFS
ncbi:MAG TPA: LptF/LptG family permease [Candidatus Cloacimonadota bacterium]|jgi:lipopolysaccharide export system permease protein|nr:LptF/LptG family permease [Candidatus Cloacimonadales bacterium]HPY96819.1 LptF/LptG family permease [Candidatus Cloacimonadota bacterium]HQB41373.1 LptF/LptG family permease [Candidatus Cloacimonadota bacterium]